jgi:hypothetical protein
MANQRLVPSISINESVLREMAANATYLAAFPVLREFATKMHEIAACSACGRKKTEQRLKATDSALRGLVALSAADKGRLKALLSTRRIIIYIAEGAKRNIRKYVIN